jgi:transposase
MRRQYSLEYKQEAVRLVKSGERSQSEVAKNLGLSSSTMSQWCREYGNPDSQVTKEESAKIRSLEAEIRRLKTEQEILKKAAAFFAKNQL